MEREVLGRDSGVASRVQRTGASCSGAQMGVQQLYKAPVGQQKCLELENWSLTFGEQLANEFD